MTSVKTQLPFEYYAVPICKPDKLQYKPENLGKLSSKVSMSFLNFSC